MKLPIVSGTKLIKLLIKNFNFEIIRQKGSHVFLRHADGRTTVVPCHGNKDMDRSLIHKILKDAQITPEEFIAKY